MERTRRSLRNPRCLGFRVEQVFSSSAGCGPLAPVYILYYVSCFHVAAIAMRVPRYPTGTLFPFLFGGSPD